MGKPNLLTKIKRIINNLSLTDEKAWNTSIWNLLGSQSLSGENVTEHTALTYSAVYNAVTLISGTIASLPLHLMQQKGTTKRIADDLSLYRVMHDQWNPYMPAQRGREVLAAHALTWGNGYAEIVRNGYGDVTALWPITPNRIRIKLENGVLSYVVRVDSEDIPLPYEKILHVPGLGFDGFQGYSVIAMARKSIGLGMAMETFGSLYFGNGTHPGMIVEHPGKLSETAHNNLKNALAATQSGLGQAHRLMLLEEGMKATNISVPPEDAQFLESRQFQIPEIARWFNIPPHKLKDLTRSSFSNIESEQSSFYTDTILPWLVRFEANYNMQLLTPFDRALSGRGKLYFKHNAEGILRANAEGRANYYKAMFSTGAMTLNEIREKEDLERNPDPLADELFVMTNMMPLSKFEEYLAKNEAKKPNPAIEKKPDTQEENPDETE